MLALDDTLAKLVDEKGLVKVTLVSACVQAPPSLPRILSKVGC